MADRNEQVTSTEKSLRAIARSLRADHRLPLSAQMVEAGADEIERLRALLQGEQERLDSLVDDIEVLWAAFGRDPDHIEEYVSEHGLHSVIVSDFAPAVAAMRMRLNLPSATCTTSTPEDAS